MYIKKKEKKKNSQIGRVGTFGNVTIEGCSLKVILLENETGVMNTTDQLNFLKIKIYYIR